MDTTTQGIFAILNAQRFVIEALTLELAATNPNAISSIRSHVFKRLSDPDLVPQDHPEGRSQALAIRPKIQEFLDAFFLKVDIRSRLDSTE